VDGGVAAEGDLHSVARRGVEAAELPVHGVRAGWQQGKAVIAVGVGRDVARPLQRRTRGGDVDARQRRAGLIGDRSDDAARGLRERTERREKDEGKGAKETHEGTLLTMCWTAG